MPVTVRNTDILFNNGTTQSTAATPDSTDFGGVGSYAVLMMAADNNLAVGGTIAGSSLRVNAQINQSITLTSNPFPNTSVGGSYAGGGTAVSGTWRKMSGGSVFVFDSQYGLRYYANALYVRIS
jgi:hypothetical protein